MAKVNMDFNGNSHKKQEKEKREKVTKGKVSVGSKEDKGFWATFFEDDLSDILNYILVDVFKPALKNLIYDVGAGSLERALFGTSSHKGGRRNEITDYTGRYKYGHNSSRRTDDTRDRDSDDPSSIIFEERGDAEGVLAELRKQIKSYNKATVGDFYDFAGITPSDNYSKLEEYGWTDLTRASVRLARGGGYYVDLPREKYVN